MTDILQDIHDALKKIEDNKSTIICSEAKYEALKAALDEQPDLSILYKLQASPIWEDDETVLVCAPLAPLSRADLFPNSNSDIQRLAAEAGLGLAGTTSQPTPHTSTT